MILKKSIPSFLPHPFAVWRGVWTFLVPWDIAQWVCLSSTFLFLKNGEKIWEDVLSKNKFESSADKKKRIIIRNEEKGKRD